MFENVLAGVLANFVWLIILPLVLALAYVLLRFKRISRLVSRSAENGLTDFFPDRDSYTRDRAASLEQYLETAKSDLTYVGHWMAVSVDQRHTLDAIKSMLQAGKQITLVLLSKDLPVDIMASYARFFGKTDLDFSRQVAKGWDLIEKWRSELGREELKRLVLKSHEEFICHSAFVFDRGHGDEKILIDQKIWGLDRKNSFGFELSQNQKDRLGDRTLFSRYSRSLKELTEHAIVVTHKD